MSEAREIHPVLFFGADNRFVQSDEPVKPGEPRDLLPVLIAASSPSPIREVVKEVGPKASPVIAPAFVSPSVTETQVTPVTPTQTGSTSEPPVNPASAAKERKVDLPFASPTGPTMQPVKVTP